MLLNLACILLGFALCLVLRGPRPAKEASGKPTARSGTKTDRNERRKTRTTTDDPGCKILGPRLRLKKEDYARHRRSIRTQQLLERLRVEGPRLIRAGEACYDLRGWVTPAQLESFERALPVGTLHVAIDHEEGLRRTYYRCGTSWIFLKESWNPTGRTGWDFRVLEIRDTRRIRVEIPVARGNMDCVLNDESGQGVPLGSADVFAELPACISFNLEVRSVSASSNAVSTKEKERDAPPLDTEESERHREIIRWLSGYADALDTAQARATVSLTGWSIEATAGNKTPNALN